MDREDTAEIVIRQIREQASAILKHTACAQSTILELLQTPAMRKPQTPVMQKLVLLGVDVRTKERKVEDERQIQMGRQWALRELATRYDREKIYEDLG